MKPKAKVRTTTVGLEDRGRRERRRTETRRKIFQEALALFSERGLAGTTVENITEAADVGKGTFFNYFESKEQVLSVLAEEQLAKIHAALEAAQKADVPVKETARRMVLALAEVPSRSDRLARSLMAALLTNDQARLTVAGVMSEGRQVLAKMFAIAQEREEMSARHTPIEMARAFQQSFFGTLMMWSLQPEGKVTVSLNKMFELLWDGVSAGVPGKRTK